MTGFPSLFVSHGSPMMLLEDCAARRFFADYGTEIGKPGAILMVSAHWETAVLTVGAAPRPGTIHDFFGFPPPMYEMRYDPPGAPDVAARAEALLRAAGKDVVVDPERGLDHGGWVPLIYMYPDRDVPVAQVSIQTHLGPAHHLEVGRALAPLRDDGVLIIGSGNVTHGLRDMDRGPVDAAPHGWVAAFTDWVDEVVARGLTDELVNYRQAGPHAARNHPSEDHFLPLLVALGAGGAGSGGRRVHASTAYRTLGMDAYAFQ